MTSSSSSAYIVPADYSSEWRDIRLLQRRSRTELYTASRYGRRFVLKALTPECAGLTDYKLQQEKEFQLGISLVHPNIAATYGLENVDGVGMCIVQEMIDGLTLGDWLQTKPTRAARRRVLEQLLDAVEYLHSRQLVHHDLKPDNIMITRYGANVKLIDFGLSDTDDSLSPVDNDPRVDVAAIEKMLPVLLPHTGRYRHYESVPLLRRALHRRRRWLTALPVVVSAVLLGISVWLYAETQRAEKEEQRAYAAMIEQVEQYMAVERETLMEIVNRRESYSLANMEEAMAYQKDMQDYSNYRKSMWAVRDSFVSTFPDGTPLHDAAWHRWVQKEAALDTELLQQLTSKVQ